MRFSEALAIVALSLAALAPATAEATNSDSQTFFAKGRTLRTEGKCADAIVAFRRALEIEPQGLGALRNVAECEEQLEQFASARNDWWNLRRAVLQSGDPKYQGWDVHAEKAHKRLESKVARITVRLSGPELERVKVNIDGSPLDPRLLGVELERDLGAHVIEATYGGVAPVVEKRTLAVGARMEVTLVIPARKPGDAPPPGTPPTVAPAEEASSWRSSARIGGFVAIGAGGLGAVATIVAVAVRQSALSSLEAKCKNGICPPELGGDIDTGRTASTLANVFAAVAATGIGVGVTLVVVGSTKPGKANPARPPAAAIGVVPVAGGAAVWSGVRF